MWRIIYEWMMEPATRSGQILIVISVAIGCITLAKLMARALKRGFLMAEECVKFVRWLHPLMSKYPDSSEVVHKLMQLNGNDKE